MQPYPAPNSVLLLDNARIHHSDEIRELIESYGLLEHQLKSHLLRLMFLRMQNRISTPLLPAFSAD